MATLDRRLIPFIEMLVELGVDWLAFELVEGIRRGREPLENEETLTLARQRSRMRYAEKFARMPEDRIEAEPILGDAQLEWAVRYVNERLEATLREMSTSLDALDEIVSLGHERKSEATEASALLVLFDPEEKRTVSRSQVEEAQAQLPKLRQSMENWLASTRTDRDQ